MKTFFALTLATFALSSCGKKEEYNYNITENQCSTGNQTLESKNEMCNRLKDHAANNGCAHSLRKDKFESEGCGSWASVR